MISDFKIQKTFKAVSYLPASQIMKRFPKGIKFSSEKINVIVGPNGAGKSALMRALSLVTLSNLTGRSAFDRNIFADNDARSYWTEEGHWSKNYTFLEGLVCNQDLAPTIYYWPGHLPGNEEWINTCLFTGYGRQAKEFIDKTQGKSAGQKCSALLDVIRSTLKGETALTEYDHVNWDYGKVIPEPGYRASEYETKAFILKKQYGSVPEDAIPLMLMDEPEQSLDARAELELWKLLEAADLSRMQVIIATHSLYPILHPERFNIIEATKGYSAQVRQMLG